MCFVYQSPFKQSNCKFYLLKRINKLTHFWSFVKNKFYHILECGVQAGTGHSTSPFIYGIVSVRFKFNSILYFKWKNLFFQKSKIRFLFIFNTITRVTLYLRRAIASSNPTRVEQKEVETKIQLLHGNISIERGHIVYLLFAISQNKALSPQ